MSTLLLRLAAPLQSWGLKAKFDQRDTQRLPTKSGVIGLVAAALGRRREESLEDLNILRMGVRADQEGELLRDFHIAKPEKKDPYVTSRYYLCDAVFLVGLEGPDALLQEIAQALQRPTFPLFLGRRSCPPQGKLLLGIRAGMPLLPALQQEPWQASPWFQQRPKPPGKLALMLEVPPGTPGAFYLRDLPLSFSQALRQHGYRSVQMDSVPPSRQGPAGRAQVDATRHDALMDWGDHH